MSSQTTAPAVLSWTPLQRNYVLFALCVVSVFNFIDRQIMAILLQPMKDEFGATDGQMGLILSVFAAFYLLAAVPVAQLSDRYPRRWVLAACLGFWSLMTSMGAFVTSLTQLALTRVGVAVAEAGGSPTSHSIISDLYPLSSRATAISVLSAAQSIGIGLGVFLGGWLTDAFNWRTAFLIVGSPGLVLAAWLLLTVKEPPRGMSDKLKDTSATPSIWASLAVLWKIPTYRCLFLTAGFAGFCGYGTLNWGPTFLRRVHDMSGAQVGLWFGLATAVALVVGNIGSGLIADRLGKKDLRGYMWVAGAGPLLAIPAGLLFVLAADWRISILGVFLFQMLLTSHIPTCYAIGQSLVPLRMRATASVVTSLASGLLGMMLAPLAIGTVNEMLTPVYGDDAVRYSLAFAISSAAVCAVAAFLGARWIRVGSPGTELEFAL